jgi:glutamate racemase
MVEINQIDRQKIKERIENVCEQEADIIVLGCTHYHWIEALIKEIAGERARVIQPTEPVIHQLKRVLAQQS